jgi:S1-C subfamily serine protease
MSNGLATLSDSLADVVGLVGESVVRVEARQGTAATGVVWSADGLVVTAEHVVDWNKGVTVGLASGEAVAASLVGRDAATDLALLRTEAGGLVPPRWSPMDAVRVGQLVMAIGRPGRTIQATIGIVSALAGDWRTPMGGHLEHYLQTDVAMYPGFSGGPLVDIGAASSDSTRPICSEASAWPSPAPPCVVSCRRSARTVVSAAAISGSPPSRFGSRRP